MRYIIIVKKRIVNEQYSGMTMKLNVLSIVGENCITLEDGEELHHRISYGLSHGDTVEVDFTGVRVYASPFFNAAIGKLVGEFQKNTINNSLKFDGLTGRGDHVLKRVLKNAEHYYTNPEYEKALISVIGKKSED